MSSVTDTSRRIDRRRFLTIAAAVAGAGLLPGGARAGAVQTATWHGIALGAPATLTLQHPDEVVAKQAIAACLDEVARLEAIYSLHRPDSALMRLNAASRLDDAPADLRILLAEALGLAAQTDGAFDPTIQPLWALYARHYSTAGAAADGPDADAVASACARVGWQHVHIDGAGIALQRPGMAVTLNGIAQGYITDRVGAVLRARGFANVLVDMGEQLAVGPRWDGTAWRVGVRDPDDPARIIERLALTGGAVATSSSPGPGVVSGRGLAHILDPRTGRPAARWSTVTVVTERATRADGLSTALSLMPADRWRALLGTTARAYAVPFGARRGDWV